MQGKTLTPTAPQFQKEPPPGTPLPMPDLSDMDRVHRLVASGKLTDLLAKLAGKR